LIFEIEDNGKGMEQDKISQIFNSESSAKQGYGIKNVDERIKLHHGSTYGVQITSSFEKGTIVHIELPLLKEELNV
jgi:two-component system sensor histidine kinase YesM